MDSTVWVAVFTGGTAVLAGWVTSQGNTRAARVQAEASERAQYRLQLRETRRAAYLALIERAHIIAELYWRLGGVDVQVSDPNERLIRLDALRAELRNAFDPLMRDARVVALEGPTPVAQAGEALLEAATDANRELWNVIQGVPEARIKFDNAGQEYRAQLERFIDAARTAMGEL
ncbi:hypothetical protein [Acrocarpospora catenulata]|uniref:hypothetical protein n=1 Tax=Acrocarpospora catenulata TaxID=2836182 RepID=UPI001BD9A03F|nr:hypothetical protein [Acrocarpospora catenulata]